MAIKNKQKKPFGYHLKRFFKVLSVILFFPFYIGYGIALLVMGDKQSGTKSGKKKKNDANKVPQKFKQSSGLIPINIKNHKDNKGGHPHVIVDDVDNKHVSVGLSTKPKKGKNATNYKLEVSPLNDGKQSYMKRQGTVDKKDMYYNSRKGKMTPTDFSKAKEYGDKAKRKYIEKKDKKK